MFLLQMLSSLARQWRSCGVLECILVGLFVIGVAVALLGPTFDGALLAATAVGLIVLARTGAIASRYQRQVASAIKPLYQLGSEERKRDADLQQLLARVRDTGPPSGYAEAHVVLVEKLGELVDVRRSWPIHRDMSAYAAAVVGLRRETDSWLRHEIGDAISDAIATYYTKDDALAVERHQTLSSAVAGLCQIAPPARRSAVHQQLVSAIRGMDELTTRQRACLSERNEAGLVSAAAEFASSGESMQSAIRRIRGLGVKAYVPKNSSSATAE